MLDQHDARELHTFKEFLRVWSTAPRDSEGRRALPGPWLAYVLGKELPMKRFASLEVEEAIAYAAAGGQALHLHRIIVDRTKAPRCFVQAVDRGEHIAHLFDLNTERLRATARRLGVRVVYIDREGTPRQHLDLCGGPLRKAIAECEANG